MLHIDGLSRDIKRARAIISYAITVQCLETHTHTHLAGVQLQLFRSRFATHQHLTRTYTHTYIASTKLQTVLNKIKCIFRWSKQFSASVSKRIVDHDPGCVSV